ncbi:MAG TPA: SRPBCC family protein [Vicinamibacterales bacterium]|nr:SRPBCC family protein [Vicinamibacterales bacterium]
MTVEHLLAPFAWSPTAGGRPAHRLSRLRREAIVAAPRDETFAFFSDAANLERLTPPWLKFRITTPMPITMGVGAEFEYRIVLHGITIPWRTQIDEWEPGRRFVDRQLQGPYRWWRHEHRFESVEGGTRVIDDVEYLPRANWLVAGWVRRDVERIFAFRQDALTREFDTRLRAGMLLQRLS